VKCPRCQAANDDQAFFCFECGSPLTQVCPECGYANTWSTTFCGGCGRRAAPVDLLPGPPSHLAARVWRSRAAVEGERKLVTVLFADLKGSMELLAERDPEDAGRILDPVLRLMMDAIHRYEGTVNQVMGDGIMALFGAPIAQEDHAARACYAALAMQDSVRQYANDIEGPLGTILKIRVGLNSGEVVVRAIGNDLCMDYSAIGETTHLAARMEEMASPGAIWLTRATLGLAEPFVQTRLLGPLAVRGRRDPIEVFELVGSRPMGRMEAAALRGLSRFVGRDRELEQLRRVHEMVIAGHGQVTAVVGEPGIGKSRLVLEFTRSEPAVGGLVLECGTVSYGRTTAYLPLMDLLRRYFALQDGDTSSAVQERLTKVLHPLGLVDTITPLLALFAALPEESPFPTYDPLRRREMTHEALERLIFRLSQAKPVLLIVEDLQWVDAETQGFLDRLVDGLAAARLHLLVTYRAEYHDNWAGKGHYRQVRLEPLARASADRLLDAILGDHPDLSPLKQQLIDRTDGNPFFLEESVRGLVSSGSLTGEPTRYRVEGAIDPHVPATIQAVLAARIDRLPAEQKSLLQCASVIGKEVPLVLLEAIAEPSAIGVRPALADLQGAELLFERLSSPEPVYCFKHSLTHDVAYGGLLHNQARALHAAALAAIERLYPNRAEHAEALAHHAVRGEVWPKAVDYLRQVGAAAFARGSVEESLRRYEQALALLGRLEPTPENVTRGIDVRLDLHAPLVVVGQLPRLIELHRDSEPLARTLDDSPRLARLLYRMSQYAWMQGQFRDGIERAQQALEIAEGIGDREVRLLASYALGLNQCLLGAYRPAIDLFERILTGPDAERAKRLLAVTVPAYVGAAGWLGQSLTLIGDIDRALFYTDLAARVADESDHPQAQAVAYTLQAIPLLYRGQTDLAVALSERALRLCETRMLLVWLPGAAATLGWALAFAGRADEGAAQLARATTMMESIGVRSNVSRMYVWWAEALLMAGRPAEAHRAVDRAIELALAYGERGYEAEALHTRACVMAAMAGADSQPAAAQYERALEVATELGMLPLVGRCCLGLGRLGAASGDRARAQVHLRRAITLFRDMRLHGWLAEAEGAAGSV
jgi:class 3 adenylate cyclase/tetratricopeptide (TPR) repeat protein